MNYKNKYLKYKYKYINLLQKGGGIKEIYFVRHGETDLNAQRITQGQETDVGLNENGIRQAQITGEYLKTLRTTESTPFECIYSSPLLRTKETAQIIDSVIGTNNIIDDDLLKEAKKGILSGKEPGSDESKRFREAVQKIRSSITDPIDKYTMDEEEKINEIAGLGLETVTEIKSRAKQMIQKIISSEYNKFIIVSHAFLLEELIKEMFNINIFPTGDFIVAPEGKKVKNCWISYVTYDDRKDKFKLVSPPNTEHFLFL